MGSAMKYQICVDETLQRGDRQIWIRHPINGVRVVEIICKSMTLPLLI